MSNMIDKLIDNIIELILGDMCCYHEEDHDEDGVHISVDYSLNNETKLREMVGELIEQYGMMFPTGVDNQGEKLLDRCSKCHKPMRSKKKITMKNGRTQGMLTLEKERRSK